MKTFTSKSNLAIIILVIIFLSFYYLNMVSNNESINGEKTNFIMFGLDYERINETSHYQITVTGRAGDGDLDLDDAIPSVILGDGDIYLSYGNISYTCADYLSEHIIHLENISLLNETGLGYNLVNVSMSLTFFDQDLSNNVTVGDYFDLQISIGEQREIYYHKFCFGLMKSSISEGAGMVDIEYYKRIPTVEDTENIESGTILPG